MNGRIIPEQSYKDGTSVSLLIELDVDAGVTMNVRVVIPTASFAGKAGPQRRVLVEQAVRDALAAQVPARAAVTEVSGVLTI